MSRTWSHTQPAEAAAAEPCTSGASGSAAATTWQLPQTLPDQHQAQGESEVGAAAGSGSTSFGASPSLGSLGSRPSKPAGCRVPGCQAALLGGYNQKYRICKKHYHCQTIDMGGGQLSRFCQQCSRIQPLSDFDGCKLSCRIGLARHTKRRRERQQQLLERRQGPQLGQKRPWACPELHLHLAAPPLSLDQGWQHLEQPTQRRRLLPHWPAGLAQLQLCNQGLGEGEGQALGLLLLSHAVELPASPLVTALPAGIQQAATQHHQWHQLQQQPAQLVLPPPPGLPQRSSSLLEQLPSLPLVPQTPLPSSSKHREAAGQRGEPAPSQHSQGAAAAAAAAAAAEAVRRAELMQRLLVLAQERCQGQPPLEPAGKRASGGPHTAGMSSSSGAVLSPPAGPAPLRLQPATLVPAQPLLLPGGSGRSAFQPWRPEQPLQPRFADAAPGSAAAAGDAAGDAAGAAAGAAGASKQADVLELSQARKLQQGQKRERTTARKLTCLLHLVVATRQLLDVIGGTELKLKRPGCGAGCL